MKQEIHGKIEGSVTACITSVVKLLFSATTIDKQLHWLCYLHMLVSISKSASFACMNTWESEYDAGICFDAGKNSF